MTDLPPPDPETTLRGQDDAATGSGPERSGSLRPQARDWSRYVAVGDSLTEGMSDPDTDVEDRYVGWADRLAALLAPHSPGFSYANVAIRGRKIDDITGVQIDQSLALQPDLVSLIGGGNDILRPKADIEDLAGKLEAAVARVRASGADVLLATTTDPAGAPIIEKVRGRAATLTAHIWGIAGRHGCYVLNLWSLDVLKDWRMWAPDRIHLSTEGHRRVALAAYAALGHDPAEADWHVPLPPQPDAGRLEQWRDNAVWAREYAVPWVQRRLQGRSSGDHIAPKRPELEPVQPPDQPS